MWIGMLLVVGVGDGICGCLACITQNTRLEQQKAVEFVDFSARSLRWHLKCIFMEMTTQRDWTECGRPSSKENGKESPDSRRRQIPVGYLLCRSQNSHEKRIEFPLTTIESRYFDRQRRGKFTARDDPRAGLSDPNLPVEIQSA